MRRLGIHHTTHYTYSQAVDLLPHTVRMRPREGHDVRIESSRLEIVPTPTVQWHRDSYDNSVAVVTFLEPARELSIRSEVVIQHYDEQPLNKAIAHDMAYNMCEELFSMKIALHLRPYPRSPHGGAHTHPHPTGFQQYRALQGDCGALGDLSRHARRRSHGQRLTAVCQG